MNEKERIEMYERVHLRNYDDLPGEEKISKLEKKHRSKWIQIVFNVVVISGLAYGYFIGYRPFAEWVYYILAFIFVLNVVLLYWQKNQIEQLADYLKRNLDSESSVS
jgi:magnesium-transporting ATPase (P-type)